MIEWHALELTELPGEFASSIKPELLPGERLIWVAKSLPSRFKPWSEALFPLICCIGAIGISGVCFAGAFGAIGGQVGRRLEEFNAVLAVVGTVFLALGVAVFFGLLVHGFTIFIGASHPFESFYALTDRRAIIWRPRDFTRGMEVFSLVRTAIRGVHRVEYPGGGGSVVFDLVEGLTFDTPRSFNGIANARRVEEYAKQAFLLDPAI